MKIKNWLDCSDVQHQQMQALKLNSEQVQFVGDITKLADDCVVENYSHTRGFIILIDNMAVGFFSLKILPASPCWSNKQAITLHSFLLVNYFRVKGMQNKRWQ